MILLSPDAWSALKYSIILMPHPDQPDREARPRTRRSRAVHISSRVQYTDPTNSSGLSGRYTADVSDVQCTATLLITGIDPLTELARDRALAFQE